MNKILTLFFTGIALNLVFSSPSLARPSAESFFGEVQFCGRGKADRSLNARAVCSQDLILPDEKTTYLDLLRLVLPGLTEKGAASGILPPKSSWDKSEKTAEAHYRSQAPFDVGFPKFFQFQGQDRQFIILLLDNENELGPGNVGGVKLLGLFEVSPKLKLLDSVDLGKDRFTHIEKNVLWSREGRPLLFVSNSHSNSSESFTQYSIVGILKDRLKLLYDGPSLYGICDKTCISQEVLFSQAGASTPAYPDLVMRVVEKRAKSRDSEWKHAKTYKAVLKWNPMLQKYMGGSKELIRANEARHSDS